LTSVAVSDPCYSKCENRNDYAHATRSIEYATDLQKISVQSSKPSHAYPIIRLPREFRRLAGTAAKIYKTTHNGALAFLVVPQGLNGHKNDLDTDIEKTSLYTAEVALRPLNDLDTPFSKTAAVELFEICLRFLRGGGLQ